MLIAGERRLMVNVDHLRDYDRDKTQEYGRFLLDAMILNRLLNSPGESIPVFETVLQDLAVQMYDPTKHHTNPLQETLHLGFRGNFGEHHVNPRGLRAKHIGRLVCVDGIVTRCAFVCTDCISFRFDRLLGSAQSGSIGSFLSSDEFISRQGIPRCHVQFG